VVPELNWANIVFEFSLFNQNFWTAEENSRTYLHALMTHRPREFAPNAQESPLIPLGIQRRQVEVTAGCLEPGDRLRSE